MLLVLSREAQLGPFSAATIALSRERARWAGQPGTPGRLLCGAGALGSVLRTRRGAPSGPIALSLRWGEA